MSFEKYRNQKRRRQGCCCICGEPSDGRVQVVLQAKTQRKGRSQGQINRYYWPAIATRGGSYCERHASELFETVAKLIKADGTSTSQGVRP